MSSASKSLAQRMALVIACKDRVFAFADVVEAELVQLQKDGVTTLVNILYADHLGMWFFLWKEAHTKQSETPKAISVQTDSSARTAGTVTVASLLNISSTSSATTPVICLLPPAPPSVVSLAPPPQSKPLPPHALDRDAVRTKALLSTRTGACCRALVYGKRKML